MGNKDYLDGISILRVRKLVNKISIMHPPYKPKQLALNSNKEYDKVLIVEDLAHYIIVAPTNI